MNRLTQLMRGLLVLAWTMLVATTSMAQEPVFCWKDSFTRGVGEVPQSCEPGRERIGLLCYSKCPAGMTRVGFDCHSVCPAQMRNDGLFCRAAEYGRGAGYPWKFGDSLNDSGMFERCQRDHGQGNCEKNGLIVYPKCAPGYEAFGCCICRPKVPDCRAMGLNPGIDLSCAKKVTIGDPVPGVCRSGEERNAGLCYKNCSPGYQGVGPVCWGQPPPGWVNCGMGAAKDELKCASVIFGQVASVAQLAFTVATFGSSTPLTAGMDAPAAASRLAKLKQQLSQMKVAFDRLQESNAAVKTAVQAADAANKGKNGYIALNTAVNHLVTEEDMVRLAAQIASIVDPTGISDTVAAYTYAKCSKYGFPTVPSTAGMFSWIRGPSVPANAVIGGTEPGRTLPICRASYHNGVHPGKVVAGWCNIGWGGREIVLASFDVLLNTGGAPKWVFGPGVPPNAVIGGQADGHNLPICRASYQGGVHPGKLWAGNCNIGYGGREIVLPIFEVLVQ